LKELFHKRDAATPPKSIIFLKLAEQGSTVLANEAIRQAAAKVGRENVFFLMFEENRFVLDVMDLIPRENVLTIPTKSAWTMASGCLARLREMRRRKIDACTDMEFFARSSAVICYLMRARIRVGFHCYFGEGPHRGDLFTHRVLYNPHLHASRTFLTLVRALDNPPARFPTFPCVPPAEITLAHFRPLPAERDEVAAMLRELAGAGPDGRPRRLILLNANASDLLPLRRWDNANYTALARRLLETFPDAAVAFTGAPSEQPKIAPLVAEIASPRCFNLAGKTTMRQLLIVYSLAEILVTNDSGPAHFAALTPIDVVVLFGPETPELFGTLSPRNHAIWLGLACSPCINAWNNRQTACRDNLCMKNITVAQVFNTVCTVYKQRAAN
jgi:ADP-heptose:LPS heptosyltransferase